jgi:hypothetical protein
MADASVQVPTYADLFPELPTAAKVEDTSALSNFKSRTTTEVFAIPIEEQRYRQLDEQVFGSTAEQNRICSEVCRVTDTQIEHNLSKDRTLTICISGKRDNVKEAKKLLLQKLQKQVCVLHNVPCAAGPDLGSKLESLTELHSFLIRANPLQCLQASLDVQVPKNIHPFLIGKEGKIVKEIMDSTSTIVRIPKNDDPSDLINVAGTAENIRAAIQKIQLIADEKVHWRFKIECSAAFIIHMDTHERMQDLERPEVKCANFPSFLFPLGAVGQARHCPPAHHPSFPCPHRWTPKFLRQEVV